DRDRTDTCHDLALRQMAVAHNALPAIFGLQITVPGEKIRDLSLYGLSHQRACALPQDFGELIVKGSRLNQFAHVIVGHGISLLRWRSGASSTPICRPSDSRRHQLSAIARGCGPDREPAQSNTWFT